MKNIIQLNAQSRYVYQYKEISSEECNASHCFGYSDVRSGSCNKRLTSSQICRSICFETDTFIGSIMNTFPPKSRRKILCSFSAELFAPPI